MCNISSNMYINSAKNINLQGLAWAKTHDWYAGSAALGGGLYKIYVFDRYYDKDGKYHQKQLSFTNLNQLRDWAGY